MSGLDDAGLSTSPRVVVEAVAWDDVEAAALRDIQQAELEGLYGTPDLVAHIPAEAVSAMVLVRVAGVAVGCGALRDHGDGVGELKRMFVLPSFRGQGLSRLVLDELEARATALGWHRLILETGVLQPEAIGLYLRAGFLPMPNYPPYEAEVSSRCFTKVLGGQPLERGRVAARDGATSGGQAARGEVTIAVVPFADPDGVALRHEMLVGLTPRYPAFTAEVERTGGFEAMEQRLARDVVLTLLASVDGVPVGTASLQPIADPSYPDAARVGEVKKVYVRPEARGSGVARRLMSALEDEARALGWTELALQTGSRQPEAITLYVTHGYRAIAPYAPYLDDDVSLCFAKRLD